MRISIENPEDLSCEVYDCLGNKLSGVQSYDTETHEVTMFVFGVSVMDDKKRAVICEPDGKGDPRPFKLKVMLPGSYAIRRDTAGNVVRV